MGLTALALLVGRILYGGYFVMSGWNHFAHRGMLADYAKSKNVPMPKVAVIVSGILLLAGGLGILLGAYIRWAVLAIAVFLVVVTFAMHAYWKDTDPNAKMGNQVNFMKNLALLGAACMLLSIPISSWAVYALF